MLKINGAKQQLVHRSTSKQISVWWRVELDIQKTDRSRGPVIWKTLPVTTAAWTIVLSPHVENTHY